VTGWFRFRELDGESGQEASLGALQQGHLEWLNLEEILSLIESRFELGHEAILPKKNAAAKFEVIAKSDLSAELEVIRGTGFIQNIDLYCGEERDLWTSGSSLKMPGYGRTHIQLEIVPGDVGRKN
jgi:hypothetical protein